MGSLSNQDRTTENDRQESVVTDESTGTRAEVINEDGRNRLAVTLSGGASGVGPNVISNTLRNDIMDVSNGGIARDTTVSSSWATTYNYSGSGVFYGFAITVEEINKEWNISLLIDSTEIFSSDGLVTKYLHDNDYLNFDNNGTNYLSLGFSIHENTLYYTVPKGLGIRYNSSIAIRIKKTDGSKKYKYGLIVLSKEL